MANHTAYLILPEKKLIVEYLKGFIQLSDLLALKEQEFKDPEYNPNYNIIDYFKDASFPMDPAEVQKYVDFIREGRRNYGRRNTVFVTNQPDQVVISTLFDNLKKDIPINIKVVSTMDLAIEFVDLFPKEQAIVEAWIKKQKAIDITD